MLTYASWTFDCKRKVLEITGHVHQSCFISFSTLVMCLTYVLYLYSYLYRERCFYQLCNIFIRPFAGLLVIHSTALTIEQVLKETTRKLCRLWSLKKLVLSNSVVSTGQT